MLLMFFRSVSLCVAACKSEDLMCALSKLAFSLNLGTSICRLMAGFQMQRNEQKLNLLWLRMVQWKCRENRRWRDGFCTSCLKSRSTGLLRAGTVLSEKPRHQLAFPPFVGFPPEINQDSIAKNVFAVITLMLSCNKYEAKFFTSHEW